MQTIQVSMTFKFASELDAETVIDSVTEKLFEIQDADAALFDADSTAEFESCKLTLSITASAETLEAAQLAATTAIQNAIHKAGGVTPGWCETAAAAAASIFRFIEQNAAVAA